MRNGKRTGAAITAAFPVCSATYSAGRGIFWACSKPRWRATPPRLKRRLPCRPCRPNGPLSEAQWRELGGVLEAADAAYVGMAEALGEADLRLPVKIDWYGGNPGSVPVSFLLSQLAVHNTHHRGQISQVLDSLKIDNDYSGIDLAFLPG